MATQEKSSNKKLRFDADKEHEHPSREAEENGAEEAEDGEAELRHKRRRTRLLSLHDCTEHNDLDGPRRACVGADVGGTLAKVVLWEPYDLQEAEHGKVCSCLMDVQASSVRCTSRSWGGDTRSRKQKQLNSMMHATFAPPTEHT